MSEEKLCIYCGERLTEHNWNPSHRKHKDYRCRICFNKKLSLYREKNPDAEFKSRLKRKYNITFEMYIEMFNKQGGVCYLCGEQEIAKKSNGESRWLAVDHCHTTGVVRKLLCTKCNNGLGQFNDNVELLQKAINYLENH